MNSFHNTIDTDGEALETLERKSRTQEDRILDLFIAKKMELTPHEVSLFFPSWPITSIRRAMTNLTKRGLLEKTRRKRTGRYGIDNYTWKLKEKQLTLL